MSRDWVEADYPRKRRLTESEMHEVLRSGPRAAWFEPAYQRAVVFNHCSMPEARYGIVRVSGDAEPYTIEVTTFADLDSLQWALSAQWSGLKRDQDVPGVLYDVLFFELDQPPLLYLVIEQDDEPEEEVHE